MEVETAINRSFDRSIIRRHEAPFVDRRTWKGYEDSYEVGAWAIIEDPGILSGDLAQRRIWHP